MHQLRLLRLPLLVEARRKRESLGSELDPPPQELPGSGSTVRSSASISCTESPCHLSRSLTSSSDGPQSPTTPTFSVRAHSRISSSASSLASSPNMRDSLEGYMGKRPLTEVKEEPQQEKDDVDMFDASPARNSNGESSSSHVGPETRSTHFDARSASRTEMLWEAPSTNIDPGSEYAGRVADPALRASHLGADYEWVDSPAFEDFDVDFATAKRRRAEPPSPSGMTARFRTRFPVLSRQFTKKGERRKSSLPDSTHEPTVSRSRASSLRSPSLLDGRFDYSMPPTPGESFVVETPERMANSAGDVAQKLADPASAEQEHGDDKEAEFEEKLSRTPLLPPVLASIRTVPADEPIQSPLQSPKIVGTPTSPQSPTLSSRHFPTPAVTTTATTIGLPSPNVSSST